MSEGEAWAIVEGSAVTRLRFFEFALVMMQETQIQMGLDEGGLEAKGFPIGLPCLLD
jgi:hypothetical protein